LPKEGLQPTPPKSHVLAALSVLDPRDSVLADLPEERRTTPDDRVVKTLLRTRWTQKNCGNQATLRVEITVILKHAMKGGPAAFLHGLSEDAPRKVDESTRQTARHSRAESASDNATI
jgi:hypothetical protein